MENKFTSIKDRVVQIAERQGISKEAFFKSIQMTSASFRGKAKETPLNSNAIVNIITEYPEVDLYWLLSGVPKIPAEAINYVEESRKDYRKTCDEKDKMIAVLKQQIVDLNVDKKDLKKLLGLHKKL
mgnify:CR=1 FL=1